MRHLFLVLLSLALLAAPTRADTAAQISDTAQTPTDTAAPAQPAAPGTSAAGSADSGSARADTSTVRSSRRIEEWRTLTGDFALVALAVLVSVLLVRVVLALAREIREGNPPGVESHWGGFGGGMGGWRLSPALSYLFATLVLAGLLGVLANAIDKRLQPVTGSPAAAAAAAGATADSTRNR
jgi:hypothetical protein